MSEEVYRSGCRPQIDATPAPHAQALIFCHEISHVAIRKNLYFPATNPALRISAKYLSAECGVRRIDHRCL
jgi:hypothetical protein